MSIDPNDFLLSSGVKSAKFERVGDSIVGIIARQPEVQQQRDFNTGEAKTWKDGKPALQVRVILSTELRDEDDPADVGERALFVKSGIQTAVAKAIRAAGAPGLEVGGQLWVKFVGEGKAEKPKNPPKIYDAKYKAPERKPVPVTLQEAGEPDSALIGTEAPF